MIEANQIMADIRDILDIEQPASEVTRESIIHGDKIKKKYVTAKAVKRPEGMHREVFALLYNDNKELPPLLPTDTGKLLTYRSSRLLFNSCRFELLHIEFQVKPTSKQKLG